MTHQTDLKFSRRQTIIGAAVTGCLLSAGCAPRLAGQFTASDTHPSDYPTVEAVRHFGSLLVEKTGGRLSLKMFAGGQLGNERDTLEIATFGGIDFNRVFAAPLNSIEPMTIPANLPFIFESVPHMRRALDSSTGDTILGSLERHGLIGLCFYDSGARSFYNVRGPIQTPGDMAGLKLRVPNSDLYIAMVNALGANAVPIPYAEIYQSLAQGVIDGAENNWPAYDSARHYEVARYISMTQHLLTPEIFVMSKVSWDALEGNDQELIRQCAKQSVPFMRKLWDEREAKSRETLLADGVMLNELDIAPFAKRMTDVWDAFITTPEQRAVVQQILDMREVAL